MPTASNHNAAWRHVCSSTRAMKQAGSGPASWVYQLLQIVSTPSHLRYLSRQVRHRPTGRGCGHSGPQPAKEKVINHMLSMPVVKLGTKTWVVVLRKH